MTVQIDAGRASLVVAAFHRHAEAVGGFGTYLSELGTRMNLADETARPVSLCVEGADELGASAQTLQYRSELAQYADEKSVGYEQSEAAYTAAYMRLLGGLDDGVGGAGDRHDGQRLVAEDILGVSLFGTFDDDTDQQVIAAADLDQLRTYWLQMPEAAQDRAVEHSTAPVSDAYLQGYIRLDDAQVFGLQLQPVHGADRQPFTGPGTDWTGADIPTESEWAYDQEPRSFLGGSAVCSAIQLGSALPSAPATEGVPAAIDSYGTVRQVRDTVDIYVKQELVSARSVPVAAAIATVLDVTLCRIGVGSGYPISTNKIVNDEGESVYEGSRTDQPYMINGVPLSSDPRQRDIQMWNGEHSNEHGVLTEPYPGFPAYDTNAQGYDGDGS